MRQWYAFYPRDFMYDTMELSLEADALYRRLIDMYYINGGPFAKDVREICRRCRIDPRQFRRIFPEVEKYFFESDGLLHHNRIDAELEKAKQIQERRAQAGRKGGKANAKQMLDSESSKSLSKTQHNTTHIKKKNSIKKRKPAKKFVKPTEKEVADYIAQQNYDVDASTFWNWNESKGWKVGNQPMKDWKAAVRTWNQRNGSSKPSPRMTHEERARLEYEANIEDQQLHEALRNGTTTR